MSLAVPVKAGVVSFDGDTGLFKVTAGAAVLMVNVTGALTPAGLPTELSWVATAVYSPLASAGVAGAEVQPPPVPVAVAVATAEPLTVAPA